MVHDGRPAAVAVPAAPQVITEPLRVPCAVPSSFSCPAQVALNDPDALVADCSVTFHLKSVHVLAEGMRLVEVHVPPSALRPLEVGPRLFLVSNSRHALENADTRHTAKVSAIFLVIGIPA